MRPASDQAQVNGRLGRSMERAELTMFRILIKGLSINGGTQKINDL